MSVVANGLTTAAALQRLKDIGRNEIRRESARSSWRILFERFKSPLVVILLCACFLSAFLGEFLEAVSIGAILLLNALIGFF